MLNIDERFVEHSIKLTDEQRECCEGNLSFNECAKSLKSMKKGKSPGSDGYTVDFYKFFGKLLDHLCSALCYMDMKGENLMNFSIKVL